MAIVPGMTTNIGEVKNFCLLYLQVLLLWWKKTVAFSTIIFARMETIEEISD
jgi:hypothetical protein